VFGRRTKASTHVPTKVNVRNPNRAAANRFPPCENLALYFRSAAASLHAVSRVAERRLLRSVDLDVASLITFGPFCSPNARYAATPRAGSREAVAGLAESSFISLPCRIAAISLCNLRTMGAGSAGGNEVPFQPTLRPRQSRLPPSSASPAGCSRAGCRPRRARAACPRDRVADHHRREERRLDVAAGQGRDTRRRSPCRESPHLDGGGVLEQLAVIS